MQAIAQNIYAAVYTKAFWFLSFKKPINPEPPAGNNNPKNSSKERINCPPPSVAPLLLLNEIPSTTFQLARASLFGRHPNNKGLFRPTSGLYNNRSISVSSRCLIGAPLLYSSHYQGCLPSSSHMKSSTLIEAPALEDHSALFCACPTI